MGSSFEGLRMSRLERLARFMFKGISNGDGHGCHEGLKSQVGGARRPAPEGYQEFISEGHLQARE